MVPVAGNKRTLHSTAQSEHRAARPDAASVRVSLARHLSDCACDMRNVRRHLCQLSTGWRFTLHRGLLHALVPAPPHRSTPLRRARPVAQWLRVSLARPLNGASLRARRSAASRSIASLLCVVGVSLQRRHREGIVREVEHEILTAPCACRLRRQSRPYAQP